LSGLLVFVAVLGAPVVHAPVLALDLFKKLKRPLDGGATIGSRRVLGDNKTWRGALFMVAGPALAALALTRWPAFRDALPDAVADSPPLLWGALVGLGVVVGELPNSFLKRRLDIAPGTQRRTGGGIALIALDQADLVPGVWLCLAPIYVLPLLTGLVAIVAVSAAHLLVNVIGYAIGARTSPL
jgi:CDP-2,3-bis-(O-geranylgeranyl)-sn-glycerol synthase